MWWELDYAQIDELAKQFSMKSTKDIYIYIYSP